MASTKNETSSKKSKPIYVYEELLESNPIFCMAAADDNARGKSLGVVESMSPYKNIDDKSMDREKLRSGWKYIGERYDSHVSMRQSVARHLASHRNAEGGDVLAADGGNPPSGIVSHVAPVLSPPVAAATTAVANAATAAILDGCIGNNWKVYVGEAIVKAAIAAGRERKSDLHCVWCGKPHKRANARIAHERSLSCPGAPPPPTPVTVSAPPVPAPAPAAAAAAAANINIGGAGTAAAAQPATEPEEEDDDDDADALCARPADDGSVDAVIAPLGRDGNGPKSSVRAISSAFASLSPLASDAGLGAIADGGGVGGGGTVDAADDLPEYQMNALGLVYGGRLVNTSKPYTLTLADGKSKIEVQWLPDHRKFVLLPNAEAGRDEPFELALASRDSPPPPLWYLLDEDHGIMAKLPDGVVKQTIELPSMAPRARTPAAGTSASATAPSTPKDSYRKKPSASTFPSKDRPIRRRGSSRNPVRSIGAGQLKDDRDYASDEDDDRSNTGPAPVHFTFSPTTVSTSRPRSSCSPGDGFGVDTGLSNDDYVDSNPSTARSSRNFSLSQHGRGCEDDDEYGHVSNGFLALKSPGSPRHVVRGDGRPPFRTPKRRSRAHSHDTPNLISGGRTPKARDYRREAPLTVSRSDFSRDPRSKGVSGEIFLQYMEQQGQTNGILQGGILAAVGECKKAVELGTKAVDLAASAQAGAVKAQVDASKAQADASKALQQNAETKQRLNEFGKLLGDCVTRKEFGAVQGSQKKMADTDEEDELGGDEGVAGTGISDDDDGKPRAKMVNVGIDASSQDFVRRGEFNERIEKQDGRLNQHQHRLDDAAYHLRGVEGKAAKIETLEEEIEAHRAYADGRIKFLGQRVDAATELALAASQKTAK